MSNGPSKRRLLRETATGEATPRHHLGQADGSSGTGPALPEEHVVGIERGGDSRAATSMASSVKTELDFGRVGKAVVGRFSDQALDRLRQRDDVRYVERDRPMTGLAQTEPWGIPHIDADQTQSGGVTGDGVHVAVLDTGIDSDHPDLVDNLGTGSAFIDCGTNASGDPCTSIQGSCDQQWDDDNSHGTHVAGTVGAVDNSEGVVGVAPDATLHAVKVLDCANSGTGTSLAEGLNYVADQGWDVANMSLGFGFVSGEAAEPSIVTDAVDYAHERGVLMVAAAGNDGNETVCGDGECVQYPAANTKVIAVSALMTNEDLAAYSNVGSEIEVSAPGGGDTNSDSQYSADELVYSTVPTESSYNSQQRSYWYKVGTSMASPHVAGVAALLVGDTDFTDNAGVRDRLGSTATDVGLSVTEQGLGQVDADAATVSVTQWTQSGDSRFQYASPVLGSSHVFVGGLDDDLVARDPSTGNVNWSVTRDGSLADSTPALSNGTVFVGSGGGSVYALAESDGTEQWTYPTDSALVSSPAVDSGTVYVGSNDGTVVALAEGDGTEQWTTDVGGAVYSKPAVGNGLVCVTTDDGALVALDDQSGVEQWRVSTGAELGHTAPTIANGNVYFAADTVSARDPNDGSLVWETVYGGTVGSTPVYDSGRVYVGSADGNLYAFDDDGNLNNTPTGDVLWSHTTGGPVGSTPAVVGTSVLVGSDDGTLYLLNGATGDQLASATVGKTRSTPAVGTNATYVGTWDGQLLRIESLVG